MDPAGLQEVPENPPPHTTTDKEVDQIVDEANNRWKQDVADAVGIAAGAVTVIAAAGYAVTTDDESKVAGEVQTLSSRIQRFFGSRPATARLEQAAESLESTVEQHADEIEKGAADAEDAAAGTGRGLPTFVKGGARPTAQQTEADVHGMFEHVGAESQVSFKAGEQVPYGTLGSTRPDEIVRTLRTSVEAKNYNLSTAAGQARLVRNVTTQAAARALELPARTQQIVIIDTRGQTVLVSDAVNLGQQIVSKSNGILSAENVGFIFRVKTAM